MAESGAAGLSLGEVALRMGIHPPSLYEYFGSKNAIYDELFARGWRQLSEWMARFDAPPGRLLTAPLAWPRQRSSALGVYRCESRSSELAAPTKSLKQPTS